MLEVIGIVLFFVLAVVAGPFVSALFATVAIWLVAAAIFAIAAALIGFSMGKAFLVALVMVPLVGIIFARRNFKSPAARKKPTKHEM